jgi:hypothetical protein
MIAAAMPANVLRDLNILDFASRVVMHSDFGMVAEASTQRGTAPVLTH